MRKTASFGRILLVVSYTYPFFSGSGLNAFNFARYLGRNNIPTTVLSFNRNLKLLRKESIHGVAIRRIAYFNRNSFTKILSLILILPAYISAVMTHDILMIYGAHIIGYPFLIWLGWLFRRKVVFQSLLPGLDDPGTVLNRNTTGYDGEPEPGGSGTGSGSRMKWLTLVRGGGPSRLFRRISAFHAINPVFGKKFLEVGGDSRKVLTCPQGFDPVYFHPLNSEKRTETRVKYGMAGTGLILLCAGSVIPRKGFRELFGILSGIPLDFTLYIIGEYNFPRGHFLSPFEEQAREIRRYGEEILGNKIVFTGPLQNVNEYMQAADIFLLPSLNEGLPNVLLEAMACGCSVICRELPGIRGFLLDHDKTGIIFWEPTDLKDQLLRLAGDPEFMRSLGRRASEYVLNNATFEIVWNRLRKLLIETDASR